MAFLDACDHEEDEERDDDDDDDDSIDYYGTSASCTSGGGGDLCNNTISAPQSSGAITTRMVQDVDANVREMEALVQFRNRLVQLAGAYALQKDDLTAILKGNDEPLLRSPEKYCAALLIHSELRTLQFFALGSRRCRAQVEPKASVHHG